MVQISVQPMPSLECALTDGTRAGCRHLFASVAICTADCDARPPMTNSLIVSSCGTQMPLARLRRWTPCLVLPSRGRPLRDVEGAPFHIICWVDCSRMLLAVMWKLTLSFYYVLYVVYGLLITWPRSVWRGNPLTIITIIMYCCPYILEFRFWWNSDVHNAWCVTS